MIKPMDKTTCRGRIVDTKLVQCKDGFTYNINRVRVGVIDTVNLSYAIKGRNLRIDKNNTDYKITKNTIY